MDNTDNLSSRTSLPSGSSRSNLSAYQSAAESFDDAQPYTAEDAIQDSQQKSSTDETSNDDNNTISMRNQELDYSDVESFKKSSQQLPVEDQYDDELEKELTRVSTNINKIIRTISGHEKAEPKLIEEDDPEIIGYDPRKVDWDGPDDPDCPYNWPTWKRWYCTMTTAILCLVITLGSSIYVDAIPEMMVKWGISQTLGLAGLTFYLIGLAFGPAVAAPLSELFGRKIVYCINLPVCMLFVMGVGLSKHIREVLILRFFAGLTSSGALAIAGGTITDVWRPQEIGLAMTLFCLAPLAGPVIGPIIGGFVAENKVSPDLNVVGGLRWCMWVNLFFAAVVFIPLFAMPETYKPIIMKTRLKKRGKKIAKGKVTGVEFLIAMLFVTLLKPMEMLVVEPIVLVFSIYTAFVFAVLFGFFEAFPVIFRGIYGMSLGISGLPFLGVGLGLLSGAALYVWIDKKIFFKKWPDGYVGLRDKEGNNLPPTPESRLLPCMIGSLTMAPSLFWLAWTARSSVHWMAPVASGVFFGFSLVLIFFSILTYFSMAYPPISVASAIAANNFARYIVSSVFPLFTVQMLENRHLHVYWGLTVFAFIALLLIPVPWIFSKYGATLREKSKYGWTAMLRQEREEKEKAEKQEV